MATTPPKLCQIGATAWQSVPMALGCYSMSHAYGQRDDQESIQVIQRAIDAGVSLIDTADFYGWGHNESLVARAIQQRRSEVLLSTKFGYVRKPDGTLGVNGQPAHLRQAVEGSLQRLKTDHVDLLFQHRLDATVPIEETVGAMARLVEQGKVGALGLCEVSASTLRRAAAVHPIAAVQIEYSLWTREPEQGLLAVCDALQVTPMAFSPLARGMLTGQLRSLDQLAADDVRRKYPRFSAENFVRNLALVDQLQAIAQAQGCTLAQLALAWLYAKAPRVIAICGCDTLDFLDDNLGALQVQLSPAQIDTISALFAPGQVHGDRYTPALMQLLDRD